MTDKQILDTLDRIFPLMLKNWQADPELLPRLIFLKQIEIVRFDTGRHFMADLLELFKGTEFLKQICPELFDNQGSKDQDDDITNWPDAI